MGFTKDTKGKSNQVLNLSYEKNFRTILRGSLLPGFFCHNNIRHRFRRKSRGTKNDRRRSAGFITCCTADQHLIVAVIYNAAQHHGQAVLQKKVDPVCARAPGT